MNYVKKISDLHAFDDESRFNGFGDSLIIEKGVQDYDWVSRSDLTDNPIAPGKSISFVYIFAHIGLLGCVQFMAKGLMQVYNASPFEILIVKSGIEMLMSFAYFWRNDLSLFDVESVKANKLLGSSIVGFFAFIAHFVALQKLPIGIALALAYLSYHLTDFLDSLLFSYMIRSFQILGYAAAFIGAIMIVCGRDDESAKYTAGVVAGLVACLLFGARSVLVREIVATVDPILCFTYTNLAVSCFATVMEFTNHDTSIPHYTIFMCVLLLLIGVMGWLSNYALALIVQHERNVLRPYAFRYLITVAALLYSAFAGELTVVSGIGIGLIGVQLVVAMLR